MRSLFRFIVSIVLAVTAFASVAQAQVGFDRRGGDYTSFAIRNGDPEQCAARCERDGRCRAWSFSYPRTAAAAATCWLKNKVTPRSEDTCCISGVRGAGVVEPRTGPVEYSIDRSGGDFRWLDVAADPNGDACKAACEADNKCRAWTYARPGYVSAAPRCFLKEKVTPPRSRPCCVSGVVR